MEKPENPSQRDTSGRATPPTLYIPEHQWMQQPLLKLIEHNSESVRMAQALLKALSGSVQDNTDLLVQQRAQFVKKNVDAFQEVLLPAPQFIQFRKGKDQNASVTWNYHEELLALFLYGWTGLEDPEPVHEEFKKRAKAAELPFIRKQLQDGVTEVNFTWGGASGENFMGETLEEFCWTYRLLYVTKNNVFKSGEFYLE